MPIRGLTDRQASFPQIGVLRKGGEKVSEKRPGPDLTYFRLDTNDEGALKTFQAAYGSEPRDINCFLPFASVEENFQTSREEWTAGALKHRCDGVTCSVWLKADGTYSQEPIPCPGGCKPQGRLRIIVAELRRLAYVVVMTTSLHDIMTLQDNLTAYEMLRGDLRGIPFILKRRPRMVSTPEVELDRKSPNYGKPTGKRVRREKWLLSIEAAPVWQNAQLSAMQQVALPDGRLLELEAPDDDGDDELPALPSGIVVDQQTGEIVKEMAPEKPKGQPTKPHKPSGNGGKVAADPTSQFWAYVRERGIDMVAAQGILSEAGGDFAKALDLLQGAADLVPPSDEPLFPDEIEEGPFDRMADANRGQGGDAWGEVPEI